MLVAGSILLHLCLHTYLYLLFLLVLLVLVVVMFSFLQALSFLLCSCMLTYFVVWEGLRIGGRFLSSDPLSHVQQVLTLVEFGFHHALTRTVWCPCSIDYIK